jgi:hypothetical protein
MEFAINFIIVSNRSGNRLEATRLVANNKRVMEAKVIGDTKVAHIQQGKINNGPGKTPINLIGIMMPHSQIQRTNHKT